ARDDPPPRSGGADGLAHARPQGRNRAEGERRAGWSGGYRQAGSRGAGPRCRPGAGKQDVAAARRSRASPRARPPLAADVPRGAGARVGRQRRWTGGGRSPPGSPRSRMIWRSCFLPESARRSSASCRRVSLRLPRGAVLEIDPMTDVLGIVAALLGGGIAAGVAFYALGRRFERRTADA